MLCNFHLARIVSLCFLILLFLLSFPQSRRGTGILFCVSDRRQPLTLYAHLVIASLMLEKMVLARKTILALA